MSEENADAPGKLISHYSGVDHEHGPPIYTREDMYNAIFELGKFGDLSPNKLNNYCDMMSGVRCLVASEVIDRASKSGIPLSIYCFDIAFDGLGISKRKDLESMGFNLQHGDITEGTGFDRNFFIRATERFGVKNYDRETQEEIMQEINQIMKPGGVFVLIDMISPESSYDWMQQERRRKSRHTIGEENARHHIPTMEMWFELLEKSGFNPDKDNRFDTKSYVNTSDWVKSNQMGREGQNDMNRFLLDAPDTVKRDFNIREEDGSVKIDYPVTVISAKSI